MRVAIPTNNPGGLSGVRSEHFGHCDVFTVVDLGGKQPTEAQILQNVPHGSGGCMGPVSLLKNAGVEAIVVAGMGARPMQGFAEAGITVYFADQQSVPDVAAAIAQLSGGKLPVMRPSQVCQGSGDCQH